MVERGVRKGRAGHGLEALSWRRVENVAQLVVRRQERLDGGQELRPTRACVLEKGSTLLGREGQCFLEKVFFAHGFCSELVGAFLANPSISFL